jgi:hypothetical protein
LFHLAAIRPDKSRGPGDPGGPHPNAMPIAPSIRAPIRSPIPMAVGIARSDSG